MTYCANADCPFKECYRHLCNLKKVDRDSNKYVNIADYSGHCRDYIGYLVRGTEYGFV